MASEPQTSHDADGNFLARHGAVLITIAVVVVAIAAIASIPDARHAASLSIHGDLTGLRTYIKSLGAGGFALLFALMLLHTVLPYPSEILTTTAGFVYGFVPGMLFAIFGWTVVAFLTYVIGRTIGRPVLRTILGKRFTELERGVETGGVRLMLVARLLPIVPLSLLGYVVGATRGNLWRLMWTSFIGYLPLTAVVAYLGSQAKSLSTSNPILWICVIAIVALIVGSHFWSRHQQKEHPATAEDPQPQSDDDQAAPAQI
jgi:uncharacterized membrane protein YdjX (TVP38/TMEM64 family)